MRFSAIFGSLALASTVVALPVRRDETLSKFEEAAHGAAARLPTDKLTSVTESLPVEVPSITKVEHMSPRGLTNVDLTDANTLIATLNSALVPINALFAEFTPLLTQAHQELHAVVDQKADFKVVMASVHQTLLHVKPQIEELVTDVNTLDLNAIKDKVSGIGGTGNQAIADIDSVIGSTQTMLAEMCEEFDAASGLALSQQLDEVNEVKSLAAGLLAKVHTIPSPL